MIGFAVTWQESGEEKLAEFDKEIEAGQFALKLAQKLESTQSIKFVSMPSWWCPYHTEEKEERPYNYRRPYKGRKYFNREECYGRSFEGWTSDFKSLLPEGTEIEVIESYTIESLTMGGTDIKRFRVFLPLDGFFTYWHYAQSHYCLTYRQYLAIPEAHVLTFESERYSLRSKSDWEYVRSEDCPIPAEIKNLIK